MPSEFYERFGLGDEATPQDAHKAFTAIGRRKSKNETKAYEGVVAELQFKNGVLHRIEFLPIDLGFGELLPNRGRPQLANRDLGRKIIAELKMQSKKFGSRVTYLESDNTGVVELQ